MITLLIELVNVPHKRLLPAVHPDVDVNPSYVHLTLQLQYQDAAGTHLLGHIGLTGRAELTGGFIIDKLIPACIKCCYSMILIIQFEYIVLNSAIVAFAT